MKEFSKMSSQLFDVSKRTDYSTIANINPDINFSLALPFTSTEEDGLQTTKETLIKAFDKEGAYSFLKMVVTSPKGPLTSIDMDVLHALTTIFVNQRKAWYLDADFGIDREEDPDRVYFNYSDICNVLDLDPDAYSSKVGRSLEKLSEVKIYEKVFQQEPHGETIRGGSVDYKFSTAAGKREILKGVGELSAQKLDEIATELVDNGGSLSDIQYSYKGGKYSGVRFIDLNSKVASRLRLEALAIPREIYNSIRSGVEKRIMIFLQAKSFVFNGSFSFPLKELSNVTGINYPSASKTKARLKEHLENIKRNSPSFQYIFSERSDGTEVCVSLGTFKSGEEVDAFYQELVECYGKAKMTEIDFPEQDMKILREELKGIYEMHTKTPYYNWVGEDFDPIEFVTDQVIHQAVNGYKIHKGIRAAIRGAHKALCVGEFKVNDEYRHFVTERNSQKHRRLEDEASKNVELAVSLETKAMDQVFDARWSRIITPQTDREKRVSSGLRAKALQTLQEEDSNFSTSKSDKTVQGKINSMILETRMKVMVRAALERGDMDILNSTTRKMPKARLVEGHPDVFQEGMERDFE